MSARREMRALVVFVFLLFALAAGMGWLVGRGVTRGETPLPIKQATLRRPVSRSGDPGMYWFAIAIYATVGVGALGLGAFLIHAARRTPRQAPRRRS